MALGGAMAEVNDCDTETPRLLSAAKKCTLSYRVQL